MRCSTSCIHAVVRRSRQSLLHCSNFARPWARTAYIRVGVTSLVICFGLVGFTVPTSADISDTAAPFSPLAIKYQELEHKLTQSIFGAPILLNSETGEDYVQGEVYALLETPFDALNETLSQPAQWCDLAILHQNIKTCIYGKNEAGKDQLQFYVGRKHYQEPSDAHSLLYRFEKTSSNSQYLDIKLTAPSGPLGTSNYLISFEAVPIDEQHSFIHFQYRYEFGFLADLAMSTYLATLGRKKVGFTVIGTYINGEHIYIKGLHGVIERNVMRYIFAIQSVLDARKSPEEFRQKERLVSWYAHISKHPKQLVGLTRKEYLYNKKREIKNQEEMQASGGQLNDY